MIDPSRLTGLPDEGASSIDAQLALHTRLGWDSIELRSSDGVNVCGMSDAEFDRVAGAVEDAGLRTVAFGSAIANWSRSAEDPFETDRDDLLRSVPRMRRLKCRFLRIMSYTRGGLDEATWAETAVARIRELVRIASGEGVVLVLENCDGWAAKDPKNLRRLLEEIPDPALQVVFDPGNPLHHGESPERVVEYFHEALDRIVHFHIKDCYRESDGSVVHCYPGDGQCLVEPFIGILERLGYTGMYSIEPHMTNIFENPAADSEEEKGRRYLEYGRRASVLLAGIEAGNG